MEPVGGTDATIAPPEVRNGPETATAAVLALSWEQIGTIAGRFDSLRPAGSRRPLWTVEHDSLTRPLVALVTGPKSYAVWHPNDDGGPLPSELWYTETGLGSPTCRPSRDGARMPGAGSSSDRSAGSWLHRPGGRRWRCAGRRR